MKICISATDNSLDAFVDPRFGRCSFFLIVDPETMQFETMANEAIGAMGGAGIQAAQALTNKGVGVLITGNVGPNAFQALSASNIQIITGVTGPIREVIEKYKKGELTTSQAPTVAGHFGMGPGRRRNF